MTLGEKIKEARKQCGLSQEQLAEKMCVSRSAVAKWETDKGIPDIENLKALSGFLGVSIDCLLDESKKNAYVTRETYTLSDYGKGSKKKKKDRVVFEKFPGAEIHTLLGKQKLTKREKIVDNILGFFTDAPFGTPDLINSLKHLDKEFYLIEKDGKQFLVTVTDEWVEARQIMISTSADTFEIEDWIFTKCSYKASSVRKN